MSPRLRFFIVRPEVATQTLTGAAHKQLGPIVPLIPADELPDWLNIVGAPRELSVEQTMSLSNLGTVAKNDEPFAVHITYSALDFPQQQQPQLPGATIGSWADDIPGTPPPQAPVHPADKMKAPWTTEPRHGLSSSIHNRPDGSPTSTASTKTTTTTHPYHTPPPSPPTAAPVPVLAGPSPAAHHHHQLPTSAPAPAPSPQTQKSDDYCRHWCHHGTCKWGNQCRYKHAMPTTTQGLVDVGLREFPSWWLMAGGGGGGGPVPHNSNHGQQQLGLGHAPGHLNHGQQQLGLANGPQPMTAMHQQHQHHQQQFLNPPTPTSAPAAGELYAARLAALHLGLLPPSSAPAPPPSSIRTPNLGGGGGGMGYPPLHHGMMMPLGGVVAPHLSNKKLKAQLRDVVGWLNRVGITMGPTGATVNRLMQQRRRDMMGGGVEEEVQGQVQVQGEGQGGKAEGGAVAQGQGAGASLPAAVVVQEEERLLEL